ncbi:AAA family ATPase [Dyella flagellata]|nr:ATP-binding protein [Dyella flagellata]
MQLLARRNSPRIEKVATDVGQQLARRAASRFGREPEGNTSLEPISTIHISDFKSIKTLRLDLNDKGESDGAPCLMVLGENSVGKSSILQAVALSLCSPGAMKRLKLDRTKYVRREAKNWDVPGGKTPSVALTFGDSEQHHFMWPSTSAVQRNRKRNLPMVLAYGVTRLLDEEKTSLQVPISPLFDASHTLPNPEPWLRDLSDHRFNAVARALRIILALRDGDDIYREDDTGRRIMVRTQGRVAPLSQLSDGYKSLLALIVNIMSVLLKDRQDLEFAEGVVLIDEIESHLHPRWKMRVVGALRKALPRVQFIFTTHDPLCLRGMKHGEVVVMYRDQEGELHALAELPDVSKLRVDQLLTSEFFGLSSAIDPEQDKLAAQLSELAAIPESQLTDQQRRKRDELLANYPGVQIIGSSVDRQIVSQAITRHLDEQSQQSYWSHLDARKDSVKRILEALKRASEL